MDVYIDQASLLCTECAEALWLEEDGPYPNGGGEADCPQHCDNCGKFLENPLTEEGYSYLREQLEPWTPPENSVDWQYGSNHIASIIARHAEPTNPIAAQWAEFYPEAWEQN